MPQETPWDYAIKPYRPAAELGAWKQSTEHEATCWFGFRERGDDRRCFGVFPSRQDAEKAMDLLKQQDMNPPPPPQAPEGYHSSLGRNGTEDEITIHAPGGRALAQIWFWEKELDQPGVGDQQAKADAQLLVEALNAYRARSGPSAIPAAGADLTNAYHYQVSPGSHSHPFDFDTIDIHAPDGHTMAFIELSPKGHEAHRQKADAQLLVEALNAYQPRQAQGNEQASPRARELAASLFSGSAASTSKSPELPEENLQQDRGGRKM
jgi:hypothetical protein